jgi:transposase
MSQVSFKTKLKPNNKQAALFAKHAGTARHAWNWGLDVCLKALENQEKLPTAIDLHKRLVAEVKSVHAWYYEVSKCSPQEALRHLATALKRWLVSKVSQKPRFKKKGIKDSFYLEGSIKISECGHRQKMPLHVRTFKCECCGMSKDRDFNASVNLENYNCAVSSTVAACGDSKITAYGQCGSAKQEVDLNQGMSKIV